MTSILLAILSGLMLVLSTEAGRREDTYFYLLLAVIFITASAITGAIQNGRN